MTNPTIEGTYVAEVYYGWRILEWKDGAWHFDGGWSLWQAGDPVQWVGPLPERKGGAAPPPIIGQDTQWTPEQIARAVEEDAPPLQFNKLPPLEYDL